MTSTPACWAKYGELLVREYEDPDYMAVHRLTVDTYAVQHPWTPSAQSKQSVAVHLISLHAVLELAMSFGEATRLIKRSADHGSFGWLEPPGVAYRLNVLHPLQATSPIEHAIRVREWALDVWHAWQRHHPQIRAWSATHRA